MINQTHSMASLLKEANLTYRKGDASGALEQLKPIVEADVLDAILLASNIYWSLRQHDMARNVLSCSPVHATKPIVKQTLWVLGTHFQLPLHGKKIILKRRGREDASFVKNCWNDKKFMSLFHRFARKIDSDAGLDAILDAEENANLLISNALHWTINNAAGSKLGFISLVDISVPCRRAELVIGLINPKPGSAVEAALLLVDFAFRQLNFNKLCSVIYDGNKKAISFAANFGFIKEGVLRQHIFDPSSNRLIDLHMSSMLADDYFSNTNLRKLRSHLIAR